MNFILPINEVKPGDRLIADAGFSCLPAGIEVEVKAAPALYVDCCGCSRHYLDGRLSADRQSFVGFRRA